MEKAIVFKNIKKSYGSVQAVNGINLTIYQGEFFCLLGPNGAGKSTLINMLAGIVKSTSGKLRQWVLTWKKIIKRLVIL